MAITDKITQTRSGGDPVVATVATVRASAGATLACDDLSNWPADTVHFITYQKTAAGGIDYDTLQSFKGIVSGNNIGTVTLQHSPTGVDLGNSIGDYVEMAPTASWSQDLYDALTATLNASDGTLQTGIVATAKIADGAVTAAKRSGGFKVGVIPGATMGSTGSKNITGVGFTPKLVRFTVLSTPNTTSQNFGTGAGDGTSQYWAATFSSATPSAGRLSGTDGCIALMGSTSTLALKASLSSLDADGFTLNVSTALAFDVAYEAYA